MADTENLQLRETMRDSLSSALTDHIRGLQTEWTTSIKVEKIVERKSEQMIVYKHLNGSPGCKRKCSVDCFKIVDSANSRHCLKLKAAIYIGCLKPELNAQLQHSNDYCFL